MPCTFLQHKFARKTFLQLPLYAHETDLVCGSCSLSKMTSHANFNQYKLLHITYTEVHVSRVYIVLWVSFIHPFIQKPITETGYIARFQFLFFTHVAWKGGLPANLHILHWIIKISALFNLLCVWIVFHVDFAGETTVRLPLIINLNNLLWFLIFMKALFLEMNCVCDYFYLTCDLGSHIVSSRLT